MPHLEVCSTSKVLFLVRFRCLRGLLARSEVHFDKTRMADPGRPSKRHLQMKGFTLIELVLTILILGVLAVVALPKFVDLKGDAATASTNAMKGAVETAANSVKLKCAVTVGCDVTSNTSGLIFDGRFVITRKGWPDGGGTVGFQSIDVVLLSSGFSVQAVSTSTTRFANLSAKNPATCFVDYRDAVNLFTEPLVSIETIGC